MYLHHARLLLRVVLKEVLYVGVFLALFGVVGTAVNLLPVLCRYREMIRNIDAVVRQFHLYVLVEHIEVNSLAQRLFRCGIKYAINHLVEQCLLIYIAVLHYLFHRL